MSAEILGAQKTERAEKSDYREDFSKKFSCVVRELGRPLRTALLSENDGPGTLTL